ncbi:MAG: hypothetical protein A2017_00230 [Lentisphaerae bacterium GWF2_44_16]|nr:MAG: hypothetical protein A2017_00230 [Lentisphaerae bacterium GWF2_44_16]
MKNHSIAQAINEILEHMKNVPLSPATVKHYRSCYNTVWAYCEANCMQKFTSADANAFSNVQLARCDNGEIKKIYCWIIRRAAAVLAEFMEDGIFRWQRRNYQEDRLSIKAYQLLNKFKNTLTDSLAEGSVTLIVQEIRRFLTFLEDNECPDIYDIPLNSVRDYIIQKAPSHKGNMINLTWPLKKFFAYMKISGHSTLNVDLLLSNPVSSRKRVLPCFTDHEIQVLFNVVDTSTLLGKRDYAIMTIALYMGLRGVDIFNLKLSDINWKANLILAHQQKTNSCYKLPLVPSVGNAVADYILYARPKSDSPYIFLRYRKPHRKMKRHEGANLILRYQKKSGFEHKAGDGKTFHAFRRTSGTRMVQAEIPLATVAQILGHKKLDSSKRYIALNDEMLRVCCMDLSAFATVKEELK